MEMKECCANCCHFRKVIAYNYMNNGAGGVEHIEFPGYACLEGLNDEPITLILGLSPEKEDDICECYNARE